MNKNLLKFFIVILVLISCSGCNRNSAEGKKGINISLAKVYTNLTINHLDTFFRLPNLSFMLIFENGGDSMYHLSFNEMFGSINNNKSFYALLNCSNNDSIRLNLYPHSSLEQILSGKSVDTVFFKAKSQDIINEFEKCSDEYLGKLLEKYTRNMTFVYKDPLNKFKVSCNRQGFEAPKDNSAIE